MIFFVFEEVEISIGTRFQIYYYLSCYDCIKIHRIVSMTFCFHLKIITKRKKKITYSCSIFLRKNVHSYPVWLQIKQDICN